MYLVNAFSVNMLVQPDIRLRFERISLGQVYALMEELSLQQDECLVNAIDHSDLDRLVQEELAGCAVDVPTSVCMSISWPLDLDTVHRMLVAQYCGPRLPEGCKELPEGAEIEWWLITTE